jgi:hypothetical protein
MISVSDFQPKHNDTTLSVITHANKQLQLKITGIIDQKGIREKKPLITRMQRGKWSVRN